MKIKEATYYLSLWKVVHSTVHTLATAVICSSATAWRSWSLLSTRSFRDGSRRDWLSSSKHNSFIHWNKKQTLSVWSLEILTPSFTINLWKFYVKCEMKTALPQQMNTLLETHLWKLERTSFKKCGILVKVQHLLDLRQGRYWITITTRSFTKKITEQSQLSVRLIYLC